MNWKNTYLRRSIRDIDNVCDSRTSFHCRMVYYMNEKLENYRSELIKLDQKVQGEYDKTVLTLSGGALGLSMTFISDIVDLTSVVQLSYLICAWTCWAVSMSIILFSHLISHYAIRHAIIQVDRKEIYIKRPGGKLDFLVSSCNWASGMLFIAGLVWMIWFVKLNL